MRLSLSPEEAAALREALDAYLPELERETVRTDVHSAQHALNQRWDELTHVRARLDELVLIEDDLEDEAADAIDGTSGQPGI